MSDSELNVKEDMDFVVKLVNQYRAKTFDYHPESLKYFSPLHIQYFQPEGARNQSTNKASAVNFRTGNLQRYELYQALVYIEKEILPTFTLKNLDSITPDQIIKWIRGIHFHAAKTLLEGEGSPSGEYSRSPVISWHKGPEFQFAFLRAWVLNPDELPKVCEAFGLSKEERDDYIEMTKCYLADETIEVPPSYLEEVDKKSCHPELYKLIVAFHKIAIAYNHETLASRHRKVFEGLGKICPLPEMIPEKMHTFAVTLLEKMKACDRTDERAVCELANWGVTQLIDNHSFGNANKRTSTLFAVNCVFQAFGLPDIVMRTSTQYLDQNSLYHRALKEQAVNPSLMTDHIQAQLQLSRSHTLKVSQRKMELNRQRIRLALIIDGVLKKLSETNVGEIGVRYLNQVYREEFVRIDAFVQESCVKRIRTPEKHIQRLQEVAALTTKSAVWKHSKAQGLKIQVEGLTAEEVKATHDRFKLFSAQSGCKYGDMKASMKAGAIQFSHLHYMELKGLARASTIGIDPTLEYHLNAIRKK